MVCDRCKFYFSFWTIFCPFMHLTALKTKISKKLKNTWRYHHFTQVHQKSGSDDVWFLRYGAQQMDGRTDGATDGATDGQTNRRTDWTDRLTDGWMDGQMDGWMVRHMEKVTYRGGCPT